MALAIAAAAIVALVCAPGAGAAKAGALSEGKVYEYVSYGPSPAQVANIYPSNAPSSPIVVLIHGGGWRKQGPLGRLEWPARSLQRQGFSVFEINYDQDSPGTPAFPLEPNAVMAATRFAIANADAYNGDPSDVVLVGGSAGGHLAAVAAEQLDASSPGTVKGVVTLSAPTNFTTLMPMIENDTITNEAFATSVRRALGYDGGPFPQAYAEQWSPALHAPASNCPAWLIIHSEYEFIPLSQAQELYSSLRNARCKATLEVLPGVEHGFYYFHRVKPTVFSFINGL
jgi:acetyl esterase/lipase